MWVGRLRRCKNWILSGNQPQSKFLETYQQKYAKIAIVRKFTISYQTIDEIYKYLTIHLKPGSCVTEDINYI